MKRIMVVLGSGGHTAEVIELTKLLGDKYEYIYLVSPDDLNSVAKIVHEGNIMKVQRPTKYGFNIFQTLSSIIKSYFQARRVIKHTKFDAIIGTGPGICVFPMYFAHKKRKKVIFIETISRVNTFSQTGKKVHKWADQFFVQWPQQKKGYKKAVYAGRLL
jgi:UDP-N-acetylglucosamine:LPS N-acetylglucosamine transferase